MIASLKRAALRFYMRRMAARRQPGRPGRIHNIALWQFGGVGDMLLATPVIVALHEAYPEAEIHLWCSHPPVAEFLRRFPQVRSIRRFHVYDFDSRTLLSSRVRRAFREIGDAMAEERPDLLVDLHVPALLDWWAAEWLMIRRLAPPFTLGFDPRFLHGRSILDVSLNAAQRDGIHYTRLYSRLLAAAGLTCGEDTRFPLSQAERAGADTLLAGCGLEGKTLVSMHIGASRLKMEGKMWPPERFSELATCLLDAGIVPILIGVQGEREMAEQIVASVPDCCNLVGQTGIGEMAAVIARVSAHVGHDSGPFHVAAAVGTPCVAICGRPDAEPEYLAYERSDITVLTASSPLEIGVEEVFAAVMEMLRHA